MTLNKVYTKTYIFPSIHPYIAYPTQGRGEPEAYHKGTRRGAPWTRSQPTAGHDRTPIHTLQAMWKYQSGYNACLWTGGENPSTQRKPPKHGKLCTQGGGGNQTSNPRGAKQTC